MTESTSSAVGTPEAPAPAPAGQPARVSWVRRPVGWVRSASRAVARHPGRSLAVLVLLGLIGFGFGILGFYLWAGSHFRSAQELSAKHRDAEALEHLKVCLKIWPRDRETLLLAARTERRLGDFEAAQKYREEYLKYCGEDDNIILEGLLLRAEQGDLDAVRLTCQTLVGQNHPAAPEILEAQARGSLRQFRLEDATAFVKAWLRRQPKNAQALFLLARINEQKLNQAEALADYRRAVQADPEFDDARLGLVSQLLDISQGKEALPHVEYLLRRQPDKPRLRVLLARCYRQLGQQAKAEAVLDKLLAENPRNPEALAERGTLALQRRPPQGKVAEAYLRQAAELEPTSYPIQYQLFQALQQNGKKEEARAVQKRLKRVEADIKRIQEIVTHEMQVRPHDPALHYEVGIIALDAGSNKEGLRWLHSALKEDPHYVKAHLALALYYQDHNSPGRAAYHRKLAEAGAAKGQAAKAPVP